MDPVIGTYITKGLAGVASASLLTAGVYLVPTRRTQGILVLMAVIALGATFAWMLPDLSRTETLVLNGLTGAGTVLASINWLAVRFQYRKANDRDSFIIRNASGVAILSTVATLQGVVGMADGWNSEWQIAVMTVMGIAALVATTTAIVCAPKRTTV